MISSQDINEIKEISKDNNKIDYVGYGYSNTGELIIRYPIDVVSHREGIHKCDLGGKPSLSGFKWVFIYIFLYLYFSIIIINNKQIIIRFLGYRHDDDTSLIECYPYTGRTHQLRLHLQLIGNPIANDPCYGGFYKKIIIIIVIIIIKTNFFIFFRYFILWSKRKNWSCKTSC